MSALYKLFEDSIDNAHKILRRKRFYFLTEGEVSYKFISPSRHSTGFRIDINKLKLFGGEPPQGIAKMCDALFVVQHDKKDFIIAVEIKTKNKDQYKDQLHNGCHFCQWLVVLFQDYKLYPPENPQYLGLLVWHPNPSQPPKSKTTAVGKIKKITAKKSGLMSSIYECRHLKDIRLRDIIS